VRPKIVPSDLSERSSINGLLHLHQSGDYITDAIFEAPRDIVVDNNMADLLVEICHHAHLPAFFAQIGLFETDRIYLKHPDTIPEYESFVGDSEAVQNPQVLHLFIISLVIY
jgi:hypothetical protein